MRIRAALLLIAAVAATGCSTCHVLPMPPTLIAEQLLNGLQFGLMLFLLAAGLTLVFGIMDMINLAHGSLYMVGAFLAAWFVELTGSFVAGVLLAVPATAAFGMLLEATLLRERGDAAAATAIVEAMRERAPADPKVLGRVADFYRRAGKFPEAETALRQP